MTPRTRPLVFGNWKMHMTASEAEAHVRSLLPLLGSPSDRDIAVAPPYTALWSVAALLRGSAVSLAAQDLFWEDEGPYTGEISGGVLQECGVTYVLVAVSVWRRIRVETDGVVWHEWR